MIGECSNCGEEINRKPCDFKRYSNLFCSRKCMTEFRSKDMYRKCALCGKILKRNSSERKHSISGNFFCDKSCSATFNNLQREYNPNGFYSYRNRALKEYENKCNICGYFEYVEILEVHHIDKDRNNNLIGNLEIVCPNCHRIKHLSD